MKVSDYIMQFLVNEGVKHVFMLPGGGCMHLVDSLGRNKNLEYIPLFHEQAVSIAMDAYAQYSEKLAVGLVTTGPGGTNTVTGCTASWIDSTPVLYLSGQVKRADMMTGTGVRQMGPQEVDIVSIVKPITKYAVTVTDEKKIRYHLEKAVHLATTGRRGPVWLDIPLDIQGAEIDENSLEGYKPDNNEEAKDIDINKTVDLINKAEKPVILAGNGLRSSGKMDEIIKLSEEKGIPLLFTWKVIDALEYDNKMNFGAPGIMGMRYSNKIVQESDLLIILGSRLDNSIIAFNIDNFGKNAKRVIVDIDENEVNKLNSEFELKYICNLNDYVDKLVSCKDKIDNQDRDKWIKRCAELKEKYPVVLDEYYKATDYVDSYVFIEELSKQLNDGDVIVPESSGGAGEITYQAIKLKKNQKMRNAAGLGSMGFGLPYSIGAAIAMDRNKTVLINGDGAFQLNIQELQTIIREKLPIKIFIWNNDGYASIKNTQNNLFNGNLVAADPSSKLVIPDLRKVAESYGFRTVLIRNHSELKEGIAETLKGNDAVLCEVISNPNQKVLPKVMSHKLPNGSMTSDDIDNMFPYEFRG